MFASGVEQRGKRRTQEHSPVSTHDDLDGAGSERRIAKKSSPSRHGSSRAAVTLSGTLQGIWQALRPRIVPGPALNLAVARIILATIALLEIPSSPEAALLGNTPRTVATGLCTGLPKWTNWATWGSMDLASIAGPELRAMHVTLWFSILGLATNPSLAISGVLFIRYWASQPIMGRVIGHTHLWLGPLFLIMAASPAGDALSLDSALFWAIKIGPGMKQGFRRFALAWRQGMQQSCEATCLRYSLPFAFMGTVIGLTILSAGWQKAMVKPYRFISWAFSDVFHIEMQTGWLKHLGRSYVPTLSQANWNPGRLVFHSFLLPLIRPDRFPFLLHLASEVCLIWEVTHWLLLLASLPVRLGTIAMDISFHLGVAFFIGIPGFMGLAMAHCMFLPWNIILSWMAAKVQRLRSSSTSHSMREGLLPLGTPLRSESSGDKADAETSPKTDPEHQMSPSNDRRQPQSDKTTRNAFIATTILVASVILFFQGRLTFHPSPSNCHPFDAYPGFGYQTQPRLWTNQPVGWGWYSSLTRTRKILVTYTNGTSMEKSMFEILCDVEQHTPCIRSADLYLSNRKHADPYLALRQGAFWPFLAAKTTPVPSRDQFWRLGAVIVASPHVLEARSNIAYMSFHVNGNAMIDFDKPFEKTVFGKPSCEVVLQAPAAVRGKTQPPEPCKAAKMAPLDIDFSIGAMCDHPVNLLEPVKDNICAQWNDLGAVLSDHHWM